MFESVAVDIHSPVGSSPAGSRRNSFSVSSQEGSKNFHRREVAAGRRKRRRSSLSSTSGIPQVVTQTISCNSPHTRSLPGSQRTIADSAMELSGEAQSEVSVTGVQHSQSRVPNPLAFLDSIHSIATRSNKPISEQLTEMPVPVFIDLYTNLSRVVCPKGVWMWLIDTFVSMPPTAAQTASGLKNESKASFMDNVLVFVVMLFWTLSWCLTGSMPLAVKVISEVLALVFIVLPIALTASTQVLTHLILSFHFGVYFFNSLFYLALYCTAVSRHHNPAYAWFCFVHLLLVNVTWFCVDAWSIRSVTRMWLVAWLPTTHVIVFIIAVLMWPMPGMLRLEMALVFLNMAAYQFRNAYSLIVSQQKWTSISAPTTRHWYRCVAGLERAKLERRQWKQYGRRNIGSRSSRRRKHRRQKSHSYSSDRVQHCDAVLAPPCAHSHLRQQLPALSPNGGFHIAADYSDNAQMGEMPIEELQQFVPRMTYAGEVRVADSGTGVSTVGMVSRLPPALHMCDDDTMSVSVLSDINEEQVL